MTKETTSTSVDSSVETAVIRENICTPNRPKPIAAMGHWWHVGAYKMPTDGCMRCADCGEVWEEGEDR